MQLRACLLGLEARDDVVVRYRPKVAFLPKHFTDLMEAHEPEALEGPATVRWTIGPDRIRTCAFNTEIGYLSTSLGKFQILYHPKRVR